MFSPKEVESVIIHCSPSQRMGLFPRETENTIKKKKYIISFNPINDPKIKNYHHTIIINTEARIQKQQVQKHTTRKQQNVIPGV